MEMDEFIRKDEWTNITPYLNVGVHNVSDGTEWQIQLSLYTDTDREKDRAIMGARVGVVTNEGIKINKDFRYKLRLINTIISNPPEYLQSRHGFMIMAKHKE